MAGTNPYNLSDLSGGRYIDPLAANINLAMKAQDRRATQPLTQGPLPNPAWDAFFEGINQKRDQAAAAGMNFKTSFDGDLGSPIPGGSRPMQPAQIAPQFGTHSDNLDIAAKQASLRALQAQAEIADARATDAVFAHDPYRMRQDTEQALEREGAARDFERQQAVKDATNANAVYQAGEPMRNLQDFEKDRAREEDYPYSKEYAGVEEARLKADATQREAQSNQARERGQALRTLGDLVRQQATTPPTLSQPDPNSGFSIFGHTFGQRNVDVPNPAFDTLQSAVDDARSVIGLDGAGQGQSSPQGKVISRADFDAFIRSTPGMSQEQAIQLARQHGWTIR